MKKALVLLFVSVLISNQLIAQTKEEKKTLKKEQKMQKANEEYNLMKELINSKAYVFDATWISTSRGRRINIAGGSNTITIAKDSTKAALQFFGEVTSVSFNGGEGVEFDNVINNYQVKFDDSKRRIHVYYKVKNKNEIYDIHLSINKTGYSYVDVYSNNKSSVTYDGNVTAIKVE
ncbi:MAG: DUF4251 domain-containing protein [Flavobacteriaceae bacterium]